MAIRHYQNRGTRDVAAGVNSKAARQVLPVDLHAHARRRLAYLAAAELLEDLRNRPGLKLHPLQQDRAGQYSIRINDQYRICFVWVAGDATDVEITDYH